MKKKLLFILVILGALLFAGSVLGLGGYFYRINPGANEVPHDTFTRGLVGYWDFDEGAGQTATDLSGNQNHGTLGADSNVGNDDPSWVSGHSVSKGHRVSDGTALSFDGTDDYVDMNDVIDVGDTNDITITGWFYRDTATTDDVILAKRNGIDAANTGYIVYLDDSDDKLYFEVSDGTDEYQLASTSTFTSTGWNYFTIVWDQDSAANSEIFINGKDDDATDTGTIANIGDLSNAVDLRIGTESDGANYFDGKLDQVRIYNRALGAEEIRYHYNRGGPVASWDFDEGSGSIAKDSTNNGNDGVLNHGSSGDNASYSDMWVLGKDKTGIDFDGSNDYVEVNSALSNQLGNNSTVVVWFKVSNTFSANGDLISFQYSTADRLILILEYDGGAVYPVIYDDIDDRNGWLTDTSIDLNDDKWHQLIYTCNSLGKNIYIDGVFLFHDGDTSGFDDITTPYDIQIGIHEAQHIPFNGQIDEVRIYNYARTADEILLDYNKGKAAHFGLSETDCSADPASCMDYGLVGNWGMDEGAGQTATDLSGNQNHGTLGSTSGADVNDPAWSKGQSSGGGLSFDGSDDYVNCGDDASLNITDAITIEAWVKTIESSTVRFICKYTVASPWPGYALRIHNGILMYYDNTNGWVSSDESINDGNWNHIVISNKGGSGDNGILFYINGVEKHRVNSSGFATSNTEALYLGSDLGLTNFFNAAIDEVRIYNRALSAEEVRYHYNRGGPVAEWNFDEGSGSIAYDSTGNGNDGVLNHGGTGDNDSYSDMWVSGKDKTGIDFDGSNDYVTIVDSPSLDIADEITFEAWIYLTSLADKPRVIIWRDGVSAGDRCWQFYINQTSGTIAFYFCDSNNTWHSLVSSGAVSINQWYNVVGTYDGATMKVYIDGIQDSNITSSSFNIKTGNEHVVLGSDNDYNQYHWVGKIDQVRIYNYARTADEILLDYNKGKATHFGLATTDCDKDPASCMDYGLVGNWGMDEGAGQTATDLSGNQNHGTLGSTSGADASDPSWTSGGSASKGGDRTSYSGTALSFDGTDDYVSIPDGQELKGGANTTKTIEAWFKTEINDSIQTIVGKIKDGQYKDYWIGFDSGNLDKIGFWSEAGTGDYRLTGEHVSLNEWYHVAVVIDRPNTELKIYLDGSVSAEDTSFGNYCASTTANVEIGGTTLYSNVDFNGQIDQVRIYNRALSAEEVRYHYNRGGPVAEWKMNERTGAKIYDSTGNNNDGKLNFGAAGTNTSYEDMWQGASDNLGIDFDGTDDYVEITAGTGSSLDISGNEITITAWIYPTSFEDWGRIVDKPYAIPDTYPHVQYGLMFDNTQKIRGHITISGAHNIFNGDTTINANSWYHAAMVYNGSTFKLYLNGIEDGSADCAGNIDSRDTNVSIGYNLNVDEDFNGSIDEVRIYNRALLASEILQSYQEGKMVHP